MNLNQWHKIIRTVLVIIPVVFLMWLITQDLVVSGRLTAEYNFHDASPFVLTLAPKSRISAITQEGAVYYQSLYDDPVYFDVRLPRPFRTITFWVTYRADDGEIVRLAAFANKDQWSFEVKDFEAVVDLGNGWYEGRVSFNLDGKRFAFQKYQFMFSLPAIRDSGRQVDVADIRMTAEREQLTADKVLRKVKSLWEE
ncbi:hypothetical protein HY933_02730 [Candidatus Falkowbacteria bacterium]|nr:hypothetical protein [Candidatus Falkowbacteria bacterium]